MCYIEGGALEQGCLLGSKQAYITNSSGHKHYFSREVYNLVCFVPVLGGKALPEEREGLPHMAGIRLSPGKRKIFRKYKNLKGVPDTH